MKIRAPREDESHLEMEMVNKALKHHQKFDDLYQEVTDVGSKPKTEDILFLAEDDSGEVVGIVSGLFVPEPKDRSVPMGLLRNIWVEESARNKGVAKSLHDTFVQAAREKGAKVIDIHVDIRNKEGNIFWDSLPYVTYQERRKMMLD